MKFTLITTKKQVQELVAEIQQEDILAFDLECENNLHHYGTYTSLIQISTRQKNWIVDCLAVEPLELKSIFENKDIVKLFHDASFDLRLLTHQYEFSFANIFDTQIAAVFLNKPKLGLGDLLESYFGVTKSKKIQRTDWTRRPLTPPMLGYAVTDTAYLIGLHDYLVDELKKLGRLDWVLEECEYLVKTDLSLKNGDASSMKGYGRLKNEQQQRAKQYYDVREELAKQLDRPNYFIMSNRTIIDLAKRPPTSIDFWKKLKGTHPKVKAYASKFHAASKVQNVTVHKERKPVKRFSEEQKQHLTAVMAKRDAIAEKLDIKPHLIASKDQLQHIAGEGNYSCLRSWQRKLLE